MNSATIGDLVWIPDRTSAWDAAKALQISGPRLALIKALSPLTILVNVEGSQEELSVHTQDIYEIGDLYD